MEFKLDVRLEDGLTWILEVKTNLRIGYWFKSSMFKLKLRLGS